MEATITINLEVSDGDVLADIVQNLETVLPYMADNVLVRSRVPFNPLTDAQRRAMFVAFREVFGHGNDQARYAFTRMALGLPAEAAVSWSSNGFGALTAEQASKVLDTLRILNV